MGLRINHISASHHFADAVGRSAIGVSGSMFFQPKAVGDVTATETNAAMRAVAHDAAYIFSGSAGGNDKSVFLGDVVVSGSLSLGSGGTFLEGSLTDTRIPFSLDADTLEDDPDFFYNKAANTVVVGDTSGDPGAINFGTLGTPNFSLFNNGKGDMGIMTDTGHKLAVTSSRTPGAGVVGLEIGGSAGVILGQGGNSGVSAGDGFIVVRAIQASADVNDSAGGAAAVMVKSDVGGLLLSGALKTKIYGGANVVAETPGPIVLIASGALNARSAVSSDITMATNVASKQTLVLAATNADGSNVADIDIDADGEVLIDGGSGVKIGSADVDQNITIGEDGERTINVGTLAGTGGASTEVAVAAAVVDIDGGATGVTIDALDAGAINIGTSTAGASDTSAVNIGTSATARTITVGNDASTKVDVNGLIIELDSAGTIIADAASTAASAITINSGGGLDVACDGGTGKDIDLGSGAGSINLISAENVVDSITITGGGGVDIITRNGKDVDVISNNDVNMVVANTVTIDAQGTDPGDGVEITLGADTADTKFIVQNNSGNDAIVVDGLLDVTVGRNLTVAGNLDINGTTTTIDTVNMTVQDSIIALGVSGSGVYSDAGDRGILFPRGAAGSAAQGFWYDGSKFNLAASQTGPTSGSFDTASAVYSSLKVGALESSELKDSSLTEHRVVLGGSSGVLNDSANFTYDGKELNLTLATDGDAQDTVIAQTGATNSSLVLSSTGTGADAVQFTASAGGMDITSALALDITTSQGNTDITVDPHGSGTLALGSADNTAVNVGAVKVAVTAAGTAADAIVLDSAGGIDLDAAAGAIDVVTSAGNNNINVTPHGSGTLTLGAATNAAVAYNGLTHVVTSAGTGDDSILLDGQNGGIKAACAKSIILESIEGEADSIVLYAKHDSGGIDFKIGDASSTTVMMSLEQSGITMGANLIPSSDNGLDLGSSSARFANIYTGDLNLRNDRGDWTLIEEEDFISFRNNRSGRRFRMVMEDITGTGTYGPGNDGEM